MPLGTALTHSAFNFVSIITTTRYASGDYSSWGPFVVACVFVATFLGGCSGSTSGGIKAYRFFLIFELLANGFRRLVYPDSVQPVRYGDRPVDLEMQRAVVLFIPMFLLLPCGTTLLLSIVQVDFVTAL